MATDWQTFPVEFRGGLVSNLTPLQQGTNAIGTATQGYLQASGQKPEKGLMDKIKSLFPGF